MTIAAMRNTRVRVAGNGALVSVRTVADLLERLGGIPPERVRFQPLPGTATEQDAIGVSGNRDHHLCELIDGTLVERAMGTREALLASLVVYYFWTYLDENDLGIALGADGMLRLWPGRIRIADAAFISWEKLPADELPPQRVATISPDLAVEVLSEGNTAAEMAQKLKDFFQAGTRLAWIIDPKSRTAEVYTSPTECKHVGRSGTLLGADVLPGFKLPLSKLFARAKRDRRKS
jgi:Uma2 family endonuclease